MWWEGLVWGSLGGFLLIVSKHYADGVLPRAWEHWVLQLGMMLAGGILASIVPTLFRTPWFLVCVGVAAPWILQQARKFLVAGLQGAGE